MTMITTTQPRVDRVVPAWVRVGLVVTLAVPQLLVGLWAVLAPESWFADFPGIDPRLVAAEPPFNRHLATDAGDGFLATGVALFASAIWARRSGVLVALAAMGTLAVPHLAYHVAHPSELLTNGEDAVNVAVLVTPVVLSAGFAWATWRQPAARQP